MNLKYMQNSSVQPAQEEKMKQPEEVEQILALHKLGWGQKRIAAEMGISRNTVRNYIVAGGWKPYGKPKRKSLLDSVKEWVEEAFFQHRGNAEVVRQELQRIKGIKASLRTVERAVQPLRQKLVAEAKATVRFETKPGEQMQIDFGSINISIAGEKTKTYLFVATLGYSRRIYVKAFSHERQSAWFEGMEGAFSHFGGVTTKVLLDNPRALVTHHNAQTREVRFNERFLAFASYWDFLPRACAPYRARTKGKDERAVQYVKRNAIAGREFVSWEAFEAHLSSWMVDVADQRIHGTTEEKPIERFEREAPMLTSGDRPPFVQIKECQRKVHNDACVEIDTNFYSVPWSFIGQTVSVSVSGGVVKIYAKGKEIACHQERSGRGYRSICSEHLDGILRASKIEPLPGDLARPLSEYEAVVGGE